MAVQGSINQDSNHRPGSTGNRRDSFDSDAIELGALEAEPFLPSDGPHDDDDAVPSYPDQQKRRKPRVIWLTLFFLINSLAFGISLVPRINLIVSLICRESLPADAPKVVVGGFNPQCQVQEVSSHTAMVQSAGSAVSGVLSMGMSAFLSALSDRIGRIKVIAYAAVVLMAVEVVLVALARAPDGTSFKWLFVAYTLDGLSGSYTVVMAMASAYISDCVDEEKRNVQVGRIHGSMFIGIAAGPALSSAIVAGSGQESPLLVFYIGLTMRVISIIYLMTCVVESLPQARKGLRSAFAHSSTRWQRIRKPAKGVDAIVVKLSKLNPVKWLDRLVPPGSPTSLPMRRNVILLLAINIICYAGAVSNSDVLILYPQVVFKWGNVENNMFMSVVNGFRAAVSTLGIPILIFLFQRRKPKFNTSADNSPSDYHAVPVAPPEAANTTTPGTLLDPSSFPDIDSLTSPTTPTNQTTPFLDRTDSPTTGPGTSSTAHNLLLLDPLDRTLILTSLLFDIFGYVGYAASPNGVLFTLCGAAAAFGAIGLSTSEAALTKCVQPSNPNATATSAGRRAAREGQTSSRVGELMAGLGILQSVVRIIAPAMVNVVYGATVAVGWPELVFWGIAGFLGVGVALTMGLAVG